MKSLRTIKSLFTGKVSHRLPGRSRFRRIEADSHGIVPEQIHPVIVGVLGQLKSHGYTALIVGGAVRDMLLGRTPKDFDVATDARPEQVKACFRNARIIGRRFRLVHLEFPEMTVEVSTFRGKPSRKQGGMIHRDNTWGTPEEDALRRDFTINALAFDLEDFVVLDRVGGLGDLQKHLLRTIAPPAVSIREDPVRMLRAVRFQTRLDFQLDGKLESAMGSLTETLRTVKRHRLAEETQRFLTSGQAGAIFKTLGAYQLIPPLLGLEGYPWLFAPESIHDPGRVLAPIAQALDEWVRLDRPALPSTVVHLCVALATARPEVRAHLLGRSSGGKGSDFDQEKLWNRLGKTLGNWGLLKGQVEPGLAVVSTLRALLNRLRSGHQASRKKSPGTREAWMIAILLRSVFGLSDQVVNWGLAEMEDLPPLNIPDHPPPLRRGGKRSGSRKPGPKSGAPPGPGGSNRRGRRGRRPRRNAASTSGEG